MGSTNPTGLELPCFSFVQQIRPGGSAVLDEVLMGCAVKRWKLSIKNSPGRASAMIAAECVTTGQYISPSGITLPAVYSTHEFNAGTISFWGSQNSGLTPFAFYAPFDVASGQQTAATKIRPATKRRDA